jgi:aconitate hydratase
MSGTITEKIIASNLAKGEMFPGKRIGLKVDQVLTQDATGTMVYLQFEAIGVDRVKVPLVVSYVDHNTLQDGPENAEDHRYIQTAAARYGAVFCRPGMGICHQVQLERFAAPGKILIGSDSHTPNAGGVGALAFGSGGLEVAAAMGGLPYFIPMPMVVRVVLAGRLSGWAAAKDVMLELLRRLSVKGGVGRVMEFSGPGVATLNISERASICNLGVELGATSSIFPSDEVTKRYLEKQGRAGDFRELSADADASYDEEIQLDMGSIVPMIAQPSSPDKVAKVKEIEGLPVRQVCVGSCNNSSFQDLESVARMLDGRFVHPDVSFVVTPGSRQVMGMLESSGALGKLIRSGARVLESSCGPCIGMGQSPARGAVSIRTMNRNFPGRSGTTGDLVYLASPAVAAACAVTGMITDPSGLGIPPPAVPEPVSYEVADGFLIFPPQTLSEIEVERGPNIIPLPRYDALPEEVSGEILIEAGDNISTDGILPGGAKVLPYRSNIPKIAEFTFSRVDPGFYRRAREKGGGLIVAGQNYGQGSSREHAAIVVRYLGIRVVFARSFARIHRSNLIAQGVVPVPVTDGAFIDFAKIGAGLKISGLRKSVSASTPLIVESVPAGRRFEMPLSLDREEREILLAGGLLNMIRI